MNSRAYFITATGTDSGKTYVAAGLLRALQARGHAVRGLKPVMSGFDAAHPDACDAAALLTSQGLPVNAESVAAISPWRYTAPLSPDRAAALEGRRIDVAALTDWCRQQLATHQDVLLIEGIGGVMVPLDETTTVREWMAALGLPLILVAGTYLGSLSHTLTALAALSETGLSPAAIVVNECNGAGVSLRDSLASLKPHVGTTPLFALGRDDGVGLQALADFLLETTP
jgi:dethiobiotin synthetase